MIMRKPPSEHEEWLEDNLEPKKSSTPKKSPTKHVIPNGLSGAEKRFKALNDDIQEFG